MVQNSCMFFFGPRSMILLATIFACTVAASTEQMLKELEIIEENIKYHEKLDKAFVYVREKVQGAPQQQDEMQMSSPGNISHSQLPLNQFTNHCEIGKKVEQIFVIQTPRHTYIAATVVEANRTSFQIFTQQCEQISDLGLKVEHILCDRGLCENGNIILHTEDHSIFVCNQANNFVTCNMLAQIKIKDAYAGGVIRSKGTGQFEIYIADAFGSILVYDETGRHKLTVAMQPGSRIATMIDHHPHPIIVSSKQWIYFFENSRYIISISKCPYVPKRGLQHYHMAHPYSSNFYLIGSRTIHRFEIKPQSKGCELIQKVELSNELSNGIGPHIADYQGDIYIGKNIIRLNSSTIYAFQQCGNYPQFNFQPMKNAYRKGFYTLNCCQVADGSPQAKCGVIIFKNIEEGNKSERNHTVIIVTILILFIVLLYCFMMSMVPQLNYDEELKDQNYYYRKEVNHYLSRASQNRNGQSPLKKQNSERSDSKLKQM